VIVLANVNSQAQKKQNKQKLLQKLDQCAFFIVLQVICIRQVWLLMQKANVNRPKRSRKTTAKINQCNFVDILMDIRQFGVYPCKCQMPTVRKRSRKTTAEINQCNYADIAMDIRQSGVYPCKCQKSPVTINHGPSQSWFTLMDCRHSLNIIIWMEKAPTHFINCC